MWKVTQILMNLVCIYVGYTLRMYVDSLGPAHHTKHLHHTPHVLLEKRASAQAFARLKADETMNRLLHRHEAAMEKLRHQHAPRPRPSSTVAESAELESKAAAKTDSIPGAVRGYTKRDQEGPGPGRGDIDVDVDQATNTVVAMTDDITGDRIVAKAQYLFNADALRQRNIKRLFVDIGFNRGMVR